MGYGKAIFSNLKVERHIIMKQWEVALRAAEALGLGMDSMILELGCGDGAFANNILSKKFKHVDAYDASTAAIKSAKSRAEGGKVNFLVKDLINFNYEEGEHWDGA